MSNIVSGIAQRRVVGSSARKAVLMFMAGCASDDGSGIWTSKQNMASDLEMSKRTVQKAIYDMIEIGVLYENGKRKCKNGFTIEYGIDLNALRALKCTRAADAPVQQVHVTRAADARQDVQQMHPNHPITKNESSNTNAREEVLNILCTVVSREVAEDFADHRKDMKKQLTPRAAKAMLGKLRGHPDPDAVLLDSIANGWQGIFPEKTQPKSQPNKTERPNGQELAERAAARFRAMDSGESANTSQPLLSARHADRRAGSGFSRLDKGADGLFSGTD